MRYLLLGVILLFICCSKDHKNEIRDEEYCYSIDEVTFSFKTPDTFYFDQEAVISGEINQPLTMKFGVDSNLIIGQIFQTGTCIWIPTEDKVKPGEHFIGAQISICHKDGHSAAVADAKKIMILKKLDSY